MQRRVCLKLFTAMLGLSAFTFGGGYVIIPLMRKKFVEELQWLEEDVMLDMVAMAQTAPGAVTVNVAVQLGRRMAGAAGAACAVVGTILPPMVLLSVISLFYDAFRASPVVGAFLTSMQPAVSAVILSASISMLKPFCRRRRVRDWVLLGGALALGLFGGVNVMWLLAVGMAFGVLTALWEGKRHDAA